MTDRLQSWIGREVQAATVSEMVAGVLVSADERRLVVRTSGVSGYGNGRHAVLPLASICYVRLIA
jgi:hypothetical protein